jgi:hypothetical protein
MSQFATGWVVHERHRIDHRGKVGRAFEVWALRESDLATHRGSYYRSLGRHYFTPDIHTASVWRYRKTAETFRCKYMPGAEVVRVESLPTGWRANDGRAMYRVVNA